MPKVLIYGLSTVGNIAGVMGTAFLLIPNFRISRLLIAWVFLVIPSLVYLANKILVVRREAQSSM